MPTESKGMKFGKGTARWWRWFAVEAQDELLVLLLLLSGLKVLEGLPVGVGRQPRDGSLLLNSSRRFPPRKITRFFTFLNVRIWNVFSNHLEFHSTLMNYSGLRLQTSGTSFSSSPSSCTGTPTAETAVSLPFPNHLSLLHLYNSAANLQTI